MIELLTALLLTGPEPYMPADITAEPVAQLPEPSLEDWNLGRACSKTSPCAKDRACNAATQTCELACDEKQLCNIGTCVQGACLQESTEGKARRLAKEANEKLKAHDFAGAISRAHDALDQKPARKGTRCVAYQSLGYGYAYSNDLSNAAEWLRRLIDSCRMVR